MYHLYIAFWGVICYLPPFVRTRNNIQPKIILKMISLQVLAFSQVEFPIWEKRLEERF